MDIDNRDEIIEIKINDKQYALVPLCTFHDIPNDVLASRCESVKQQFGLKDLYRTLELYEIEDPKKLIMFKLKYGV
jgi:hypothetical protein